MKGPQQRLQQGVCRPLSRVSTLPGGNCSRPGLPPRLRRMRLGDSDLLLCTGAPATFLGGADGSENRRTPSAPSLPFLGHLFPDSAPRPRERPPLVARATAPLFSSQEFSSLAPSVLDVALPTILEPGEPAGLHSTPLGLFVTSGCRGGGDRLTGHHANIALPTSLRERRGWGSGTFSRPGSSWSVPWVTCQGPPLLAQPQASGSTEGEDFVSPLLFHPICSISAWLCKAWDLSFLSPLLNFQSAGRTLAMGEEPACAPPPSLSGATVPHSFSHSLIHSLCLIHSTTRTAADSGPSCKFHTLLKPLCRRGNLTQKGKWFKVPKIKCQRQDQTQVCLAPTSLL